MANNDPVVFPSMPAPRPTFRRSAFVPFILLIICGILVSGITIGGDLVVASENGSSDAPSTEQPNAETLQAEEQSLVVEETPVIRGEYSAVSHSFNEDRAENMRLAATAINGLTLAPGETFSFNDVVGDSSSDERYRVAPLVSNIELGETRGGGVCQVSSAVYVAALYASLGIVERHPHTLAPDYVTVGLDAAVSFANNEDLKVQNTTNKPITFAVEASGQSVTVKLYGEPFSEGASVATTTELEGYNWLYNADKGRDDLYCTIASYRVYFENGAKTISEHLATDTYLDVLYEGAGEAEAAKNTSSASDN
jgi:hypothetical protein